MNLTPPWDKRKDAGHGEATRDTQPLPAADDAGTAIDAPTEPSLDAAEGTRRDLPRAADVPAGGDARSNDGLDRDGAADEVGQEGDARGDGDKTTDGPRETGADANADIRTLWGDAAKPDADATTAIDSRRVRRDTNPAPSGDASGSLDGSVLNLVKLTGETFGTSPAYPANPTSTHDKAFDGDTTTFVDTYSAEGYTGLDVGTDAVVSVLRFYPRKDFNDRMLGGKFQCSDRSQSSGYVDLFTITEVPPLAWTTVWVTAGPCRYFRYVGPTDSHTNVAEIEFWAAGQPDGETDASSNVSFEASLVNLALDQPASASSEQISAGKTAAKGNDGDLSTVFCPADSSFPDWYQVDLGDSYYIQQTGITIEIAGCAYQYKIQSSLDGLDWTTPVVHVSGVTNSRSTLTDDFDAQARYLRVTFTGVNNGCWGCLREFMAWGNGQP